jgi:hypothetical protein
MTQQIITWKNLMTGQTRDEVFTLIKPGVWMDESGSIWVKGNLGWCNVDKYNTDNYYTNFDNPNNGDIVFTRIRQYCKDAENTQRKAKPVNQISIKNLTNHEKNV